MKALNILVIDDESTICKACHLILSERGHSVDQRMNGKTGLLAMERQVYDLVLLDIKLPDMDGLDMLKIIREKEPVPCLIVMTGYATLETALEAMKRGAADFLSKPFTDDELVFCIENAFRP
jgi:DNA-binding NtrC family response regulator